MVAVELEHVAQLLSVPGLFSTLCLLLLTGLLFYALCYDSLANLVFDNDVGNSVASTCLHCPRWLLTVDSVIN